MQGGRDLEKAFFAVLVLAVLALSGCVWGGRDEMQNAAPEPEYDLEGQPEVPPEPDCSHVSCPAPNYELDEETCDCLFVGGGCQYYPHYTAQSGNVYNVCYTPCNVQLSQQGHLVGGINNTKWLSAGLMEIDVVALINCSFSIADSWTEVSGKDIVLGYEVSRPEAGEPLVACVCGHELVYQINDLDMQNFNIEDYNITIKEV